MKRTNKWSHLLGLALTAVMLSSVVLAGCGGDDADADAPAGNNAAPAKDAAEKDE